MLSEVPEKLTLYTFSVRLGIFRPVFNHSPGNCIHLKGIGIQNHNKQYSEIALLNQAFWLEEI